MTIYRHSSIKLAKFLFGVVADPENFVLTSNRTEYIVPMTEKYAARFSQPVQPGMVLTGLWFYSLDLLEILEPRANTVYALNQPVS